LPPLNQGEVLTDKINVKIRNNFTSSDKVYNAELFINNIQTALAILDKRGVLYSLTSTSVTTTTRDDYTVDFNLAVSGMIFEYEGEEEDDDDEIEELTEEELAEIIAESNGPIEEEDAEALSFFYRVLANGWLAEAELDGIDLVGSIEDIDFEQKLIIIENLCRTLLGVSVVDSDETLVRDILNDYGFDFDFDFDKIRRAAE